MSDNKLRRYKLEEQDKNLIDYSDLLYNADPNCKHEVVALWSGVRCRKCRGWFCY